MVKARILVVDDEESLAKLVAHNLAREGYEVITALDGREAREKIRLENPDLIILDLMLPGEDGLEICRRLREEKNQTPVLMLTARDDEIDRVLGLELGADDYVTKPFSVRELVARVKALLRRSVPAEKENTAILKAGDLSLHTASYEAFFDGQKLELTRKEFELLEMLMRNKGRVLKRDYLLQRLWDMDSNFVTRVLDVHISKLRDKLEKAGATSVRIQTVRGIGYRLEEDSHE